MLYSTQPLQLHSPPPVRYKERHQAQFFGRGNLAGIDIKVSVVVVSIQEAVSCFVPFPDPEEGAVQVLHGSDGAPTHRGPEETGCVSHPSRSPVTANLVLLSPTVHMLRS